MRTPTSKSFNQAGGTQRTDGGVDEGAGAFRQVAVRIRRKGLTQVRHRSFDHIKNEVSLSWFDDLVLALLELETVNRPIWGCDVSYENAILVEGDMNRKNTKGRRK